MRDTSEAQDIENKVLGKKIEQNINARNKSEANKEIVQLGTVLANCTSLKLRRKIQDMKIKIGLMMIKSW